MFPHIKNDCIIQVVGPSGSGKTLFVCKLLSSKGIFVKPIKTIHWLIGSDDGESGMTDCKMKMLKNVKFYKGFVDKWKDLAKPGDCLVIDDLFDEANREKNFINVFTKIARHRKIVVIFITQNLFHQGGNHRTRNLNVHYLILFRNPRDQTVIDYLARQMYPNNRLFLIQAFQDATDNKPHSYLFFDFTQQCPDELRIRGDIFRHGGAIIYKHANAANMSK